MPHSSTTFANVAAAVHKFTVLAFSLVKSIRLLITYQIHSTNIVQLEIGHKRKIIRISMYYMIS